MTAAQKIFLAATGQNRGKTTASLGLTAAIAERGMRIGFIKPVGQRYLVVDGTRADEDAVLMKAVFGLPDALDDMSPVTLPRHFRDAGYRTYAIGKINDPRNGKLDDAWIEQPKQWGIHDTVAARAHRPIVLDPAGNPGRPGLDDETAAVGAGLAS